MTHSCSISCSVVGQTFLIMLSILTYLLSRDGSRLAGKDQFRWSVLLI